MNINFKSGIYARDLEPFALVTNIRKSTVMNDTYAYDGRMNIGAALNFDFAVRIQTSEFDEIYVNPSEIHFSVYFIQKENQIEINNWFFWFERRKTDYEIDENNCDSYSLNILKLIANEIFKSHFIDWTKQKNKKQNQ